MSRRRRVRGLIVGKCDGPITAAAAAAAADAHHGGQVG